MMLSNYLKFSKYWTPARTDETRETLEVEEPQTTKATVIKIMVQRTFLNAKT